MSAPDATPRRRQGAPRRAALRWRAASAAAVAAAVATGVVAAPSATARPSGSDTGLTWASLGDSYAAGEGLPDPTKVDGDKTFQDCQRALADDGNRSTAWAAQVAADHAAKDHYAFVACTGAINDDLFPNPAGRLQAGQLDQARFFAKADRFDVVTFSFGGNNVAFADIIMACAGFDLTAGATTGATAAVTGVAGGAASWALAPWIGCNLSEEEMKARVDRLTDTSTVGPRVPCTSLGDATSGSGVWDSDDLAAGEVTIPELYDIVGRCVVRPGGVVVVMGYPQLVEEAERWPALEGNRCQRIRRADVGKLRAANARFNERLRQAADHADRTTPARFVFIDPNQFWEGESFELDAPSDGDLNDPSKRHALCGGGEDWLNGITIGTDGDGAFRKERSFHPKQLGHDAMARAAGTVNFTPQPPAPVNAPAPSPAADIRSRIQTWLELSAHCRGGTPGADETTTACAQRDDQRSGLLRDSIAAFLAAWRSGDTGVMAYFAGPGGGSGARKIPQDLMEFTPGSAAFDCQDQSGGLYCYISTTQGPDLGFPWSIDDVIGVRVDGFAPDVG